jgi:prepilin-type N-terminal cleavage/methylation domain-containing protein
MLLSVDMNRPPTVAKGFSLIEMMVAVAIFSVVMTVSLGALLSMSESDRRAQTLKSVINNLNFALDAMSRSIRTGTAYHCGDTGTTEPLDCASGSTYITFLAAGVGGTPAQVTYCLGTATTCSPSGTILLRRVGSGSFSAVTSAEVKITKLLFYVTGAPQTDTVQPKVTILLAGVVNISDLQTSTFNLQTSVTQRLYDR